MPYDGKIALFESHFPRVYFLFNRKFSISVNEAVCIWWYHTGCHYGIFNDILFALDGKCIRYIANGTSLQPPPPHTHNTDKSSNHLLFEGLRWQDRRIISKDTYLSYLCQTERASYIILINLFVNNSFEGLMPISNWKERWFSHKTKRLCNDESGNIILNRQQLGTFRNKESTVDNW